MNIAAIHQVQEVLYQHGQLRDKLFDVLSIIPDDQRLITDLHAKFLLLLCESIDLQKVETMFAELSIVLGDYLMEKAVQQYIDGCKELVQVGIEIFGVKSSIVL